MKLLHYLMLILKDKNALLLYTKNIFNLKWLKKALYMKHLMK